MHSFVSPRSKCRAFPAHLLIKFASLYLPNRTNHEQGSRKQNKRLSPRGRGRIEASVLGFAPAGEDDFGGRLSEENGGVAADCRGAAGDKRYFVFEILASMICLLGDRVTRTLSVSARECTAFRPGGERKSACGKVSNRKALNDFGRCQAPARSLGYAREVMRCSPLPFR